MTLSLVAVYLAIVRTLRYRRRDLHDRLDPTNLQDAYKIHFNVCFLEFPFVVRKALEFALFRTFGIPSISKTLHSTNEFGERCARRYDDTDLLIRSFTESFLSDRAELALKRLNHLHGKYKITNEDFIYVLSLFVLEPIRWTDKYEWRKLTGTEKKGFFTAWKDIGSKMNIQNIPDSLEELDAWSIKYEQAHMKYHPANAQVADATVDLFLKPFGAKRGTIYFSILSNFLCTLMDARLLDSMRYPHQPRFLVSAVELLLKLRGLIIRYFFLPRPDSWAIVRTLGCKMGPNATMLPNFHIYDKVYEHGYRIEDLGPPRFVGDGGLAPLGCRAKQ